MGAQFPSTGALKVFPRFIPLPIACTISQLEVCEQSIKILNKQTKKVALLMNIVKIIASYSRGYPNNENLFLKGLFFQFDYLFYLIVCKNFH